MRKLIVFNHVSLDGYFVHVNGSMTWAKVDKQDKEWNTFVAQNASAEGPLLFGRVTYELMRATGRRLWPNSTIPSTGQATSGCSGHTSAVS